MIIIERSNAGETLNPQLHPWWDLTYNIACDAKGQRGKVRDFVLPSDRPPNPTWDRYWSDRIDSLARQEVLVHQVPEKIEERLTPLVKDNLLIVLVGCAVFAFPITCFPYFFERLVQNDCREMRCRTQQSTYAPGNVNIRISNLMRSDRHA